MATSLSNIDNNGLCDYIVGTLNFTTYGISMIKFKSMKWVRSTCTNNHMDILLIVLIEQSECLSNSTIKGYRYRRCFVQHII